MVSSILSGTNVVTSMILIWIKDQKLRLPNCIHKFIFRDMSEFLGVDSTDIKSAFSFTNELVDMWKNNIFSVIRDYKERQIFDDIKLANLAATNSTPIASKNCEINQDQCNSTNGELSVTNNSWSQQLEIIETKLESINILMSAYSKKLCENDIINEKFEQELIAIILNRLFGIFAAILNIGYFFFIIVVYVLEYSLLEKGKYAFYINNSTIHLKSYCKFLT